MAKKLLTKPEAAKRLTVSPRAVNRYMKQGKLHAIRQRNKRGSEVVMFDDQEVTELRYLMDHPPPKPALTRDKPPRSSQALTRVDATQALAVVTAVGDSLTRIAETLIDTRLSVPLTLTLTLTLDDALQFCRGMSKDDLLDAISQGKLKAIERDGREPIIKSRDLEKWIRKLK